MAIPSDKDMLFEKVQGIFQQSGNIRVFEKLLSQHNIKIYYRNNKLTGVYYGKRKTTSQRQNKRATYFT